ncbi:unnamed protein product [Brassicogethes aeneus]|uniref:ZSWIM3 N-terminal domain-containing protein n=1 Tax=Brassicogethes aeneus TaxID=1431903 RepID=A0A9P0FLV5_BRAAE|nr:unnamed protein product [Brassicogethes aeneus]
MKVGALFATFKELEEKIKEYETSKFITLQKRDSCLLSKAVTKYPRASKGNQDLKYYFIEYACSKGGKRFKSRGKAIRKSSTMYEGCPMKIKLVLTEDGKHLRCKLLHDQHNHDRNKDTYKHFAKKRKLEIEDQKEVQQLLKLRANPKDVQNYIMQKTGKIVLTKDIRNIKYVAKLPLKSNNLENIVSILSKNEGSIVEIAHDQDVIDENINSNNNYNYASQIPEEMEGEILLEDIELSEEREISEGKLLLEDIELSEEREITEGEMLSKAIELSEKREIKEAEILADDIELTKEREIPEGEILPEDKKLSQDYASQIPEEMEGEILLEDIELSEGKLLLEDIELSEEREISEGEMLSKAIELSEKREIKEAEILAGDIDVSNEKKIPEEEILSDDIELSQEKEIPLKININMTNNNDKKGITGNRYVLSEITLPPKMVKCGRPKGASHLCPDPICTVQESHIYCSTRKGRESHTYCSVRKERESANYGSVRTG